MGVGVIHLVLAWMLAAPGGAPIEVDLAGSGVAEVVGVELADVRGGCAHEVWLRVGQRRLKLTDRDGLWVGDTPPRPLQIEVVDLTPKTPDRQLRIHDFQACDRDYSTHFDLTHGQHTAWLVGLQGGDLATLWTQTTHDPHWKVRTDGAWDVREYRCIRPARRRGAWDDDDSVVLAWGLEERVTRRYRWTETGVESTVVARRRVRSGCGGTRG
jgi:hypothetical protein